MEGEWGGFLNAFDIQETIRMRTKFSDLVRFINRQDRIVADTVFGDIKYTEDKRKSFANVRMSRAPRPKGNTFATSVSSAANEKSPENGKHFSHSNSDASQKTCIL